MRALAVWKAAVADKVDFLDKLLDLLREHEIRFCVIGGQGVNAFVAPLISLDLDLVVAVDQVERVAELLEGAFTVQRFAHSLNVSSAGSDLRVQIQTDPRYFEFVSRAEVRDVLGLPLPVASLEDVLRGKVWAAEDPARRRSKRRKDILDIQRLVEAYPHLAHQLPPLIRQELERGQ
jgi:hypothetical protein